MQGPSKKIIFKASNEAQKALAKNLQNKIEAIKLNQPANKSIQVEQKYQSVKRKVELPKKSQEEKQKLKRSIDNTQISSLF